MVVSLLITAWLKQKIGCIVSTLNFCGKDHVTKDTKKNKNLLQTNHKNRQLILQNLKEVCESLALEISRTAHFKVYSY